MCDKTTSNNMATIMLASPWFTHQLYSSSCFVIFFVFLHVTVFMVNKMTTFMLVLDNLKLWSPRNHQCIAMIILLHTAVSVIGVTVTDTDALTTTYEEEHKGYMLRDRYVRSDTDNLSQQPWYLGGKKLPQPQSPRLPLLPEEAPDDDRIINQLMHVPQKVTGEKKKILVWVKGRYLTADTCPFDNCIVTEDRNEYNTADAIIFRGNTVDLPKDRKPHQRWILETLESPMNEHDEENADVFNWTATYRHNSDIVYPYDKWLHFDGNDNQSAVSQNIAANKNKKVAWYVSNCNAASNRLEYAKELSKYIDVDIYGRCGTKQCTRSHEEDCLKMLKQEYKFYLSFENSVCKDYVTEKFFYALHYNILPIVMGATKEYYKKIAPEHSFIHVDDFNSPKELAEYLHKLDKNDVLYNDYFRWIGTGHFVDAHSFYICRICLLLHSDLPPKTYADVNFHKTPPGECSFRPQGVGSPIRGTQYW